MQRDGFLEARERGRVACVFGGVFLDGEGGVLEGFLRVDLRLGLVMFFD